MGGRAVEGTALLVRCRREIGRLDRRLRCVCVRVIGGRRMAFAEACARDPGGPKPTPAKTAMGARLWTFGRWAKCVFLLICVRGEGRVGRSAAIDCIRKAVRRRAGWATEDTVEGVDEQAWPEPNATVAALSRSQRRLTNDGRQRQWVDRRSGWRRQVKVFTEPCLSGYHPHPLYVVCTHFPE